MQPVIKGVRKKVSPGLLGSVIHFEVQDFALCHHAALAIMLPGVAKDPLAIQCKWDSDATHVILEVNEDMC